MEYDFIPCKNIHIPKPRVKLCFTPQLLFMFRDFHLDNSEMTVASEEVSTEPNEDLSHVPLLYSDF